MSSDQSNCSNTVGAKDAQKCRSYHDECTFSRASTNYFLRSEYLSFMETENELEQELADEEEDEESENVEDEEIEPEDDKGKQIEGLTTRPNLPENISVEPPPPDEPGKVTEQHLKYIAHELGLIKLCWDDVDSTEHVGRVHYPCHYKRNTEKEKILLWYAENFRRQYTFKYPKRRPLLLACDNECGIQKMVCTTIRPTTIKYPEFQTWQGCASFVADHLSYEYLENPTVFPVRINSPQEVLRKQSGHSFEYSTLLASFLIGSAYDAYVVFGYATREICLCDQTRIECPFLPDEVEEEEKTEEETSTKYILREPADLRSKFLLEMEAREMQKERDAVRAQELAELAAIREYEKPWPDELWTWRLHSWVLVLPSKDVVEPFFIESVTGVAKSVDDPDYHGIESVWNHVNYWVSVQFQGKTLTCQDVNFDLSDVNCWEHLLIGEPFTNRILSPDFADAEAEEVRRSKIEAEKHLDMPASWVEMLRLPHADYERRYPGSKKVTQYRKAIADEYAPYVHADGLVQRVTRFSDYECSEPKDIKEKYCNRSDLMYFCWKFIEDSSILERFHRGRDDALKEHFYCSMDAGIEVKFQLKFYNETRLDGLSSLIMDPIFMIENFENRTDFLYFRKVDFAERTNKDAPYRDILKITEKYERNPELEANLDVAVVEYFFPDRKVYLRFHYEHQHVTQSHREFLKPAASEMGKRLVFDSNLTSGYLSGPTAPQPKPLYLFQLESKFFHMEETSVNKVRDRENELTLLLRLRSQEHAVPKLSVSVFDAERNVQAKEGFKKREQQAEEAKKRSLDLVCDFLAPYYAKIGESPDRPLTQPEAQEMMESCLNDWKNLLVARANEIQQQFEKASQDLHDKNEWYERNQGSLTKDQEEEYFDYCKSVVFHLHTLEARMSRHREMAPQKYLAMEAYLKSDPRLSVLFHKSARKKPKP